MTPSSKDIFNRAELLLGADVMERLASVRVILFGVGGVGSWCAEGLVRSGVRHLTIVDADEILVVRDGKIVERGTHAELHAAGGVYRHLCDMQHQS